jgi:hypothetical protein
MAMTARGGSLAAPLTLRRRHDRMEYNLEGKVFRSVSNTDNGEVGAETRFHYRQAGDIVTADYSGGGILVGHLIARVLAGGRLDMRCHHLNDTGDFMLGTCLSTPERLPDGRLRFKERWRWLSGDMSAGSSEIEEVLPDAASERNE